MHKLLKRGVLTIAVAAPALALAARLGQAPEVELRRTPPRDRSPTQSPGPASRRASTSHDEVDPEPLRVLTLNAAHGRGTAFHQATLGRSTIAANLQAVADLIGRTQPHVAMLQELDSPSVWSGHIDQVNALARATGLEHTVRGHHGSGVWPVKLDYGTALLSDRPLARATAPRFDQTWYDNKGYAVATVETGWADLPEVDVVSVHLDFARHRTRARQIDVLVDALKRRGRPMVVAGDLNCDLGSDSAAGRLVSELGLRAHPSQDEGATYPATKPRTRLDWILVSPELELIGCHTLEDVVSDHLGVVGEVAPAREREVSGITT